MSAPVAVAVKDSRAEQEGGRASAHAAQAPRPVFAPPVLLQRKCACGGGCPGCEREQKNEPVLQAKLTVNAPGDRYEQEADRVASAVVDSDSASPSAPVLVASRVIHRMAGPAPPVLHEARASGLPPVQAERFRGRAPPRAESIEQRILARQGYGSLMPGAALQFMESRLNADFSDIRIHTDSESHALNQDLHAYAFTVGRDIFFAEGQYRPGTGEGNRLLAHELAHVIQQSDAPVLETRVQTARIGNWAHKEIQDRLIDENDDLMCEVHIPGALSPDTDEGTGFDEDRLDVRGYADLYRSDGNLVSGIRSVRVNKGDRDAIGDHPPHKYLNVGKAKVRKILGRPIPQYGPRVVKRGRPYVWNDNPSFPKTFEIGELKPLYLEQFPQTLGTARLQVDAYIRGFEAFAGRAAEDSGHAIKVIPSGSPMPIKWQSKKAIKIPAELDLNQKKKQPATPAVGKAVFNQRGNKRLWVAADPAEPGVLRYLLLPHPSPPSSAGHDADAQDAKLQPILIPVKKPHPKWSNQLPRKAKPGAPPDRTLFVQRDSVPADLTGTWKDQWTTWEKSRQQWSGTPKTAGSATEFLKREGEARKEELDAEAKLGIPLTELVPKERAKLRRIELWAGRSGWFLGLLRFRFGALFDRVAALFQKIGQKFSSFRDSAKAGSSLGGWQKKAVDVIGEALILMLKTLASQAFRIAADCVYGIASKILNYFIDEATEELQKILDPIREKFEQLRQKLEGFEPIIDGISKVLSALDKVRRFASMLSDIEWGLRLLIQAISCASPPALGCLWGLVAQIGFDLAAAKAIGTNLFRTRIAEPAARSLLDATGVGDRIRSFISSTVEKLGLPPEVKAVAACQPPGPPPPPISGARLNRNDMKFSNTDPEAVKARKELENANAPHAMIEDLEQVLVSGGKPATGVEIQQLLKEFQESKLSPGEFMKRLKTGKGGKIDIQGGAGQSELTVPTSAALKTLQAADWDKVAPGSFKIDLSHTPPRFLAKTKDKLRFGALIHVTETKEKGKVVYNITESGQLILLDKLGPDQLVAAELPKKGTKETEIYFLSGIGIDKPGDVLDEGDFLRGMTLDK
jgi:hypothetical protein